MAKGPRLSIIIVNYNTGGLLERCLFSVFENAPDADVEVFVVDNASSDDSLQRISKFGRRLKLISNQENLGFARGCNKGLKESRGEYVLFLNPDTEIQAGALTKMISFMEAHKEVGFLVPKICLPNGEFQQDSIGPFPSLLHILLFWSSLGTIFPFVRRLVYRRYLKPEGAFQVDWGTGACLLCRGELLEKLKGFDEDFFMYHEDTDLCYRARRIGAKVYFYSGAEIVHHRGRSCQDKQMMEAIGRRGFYCFFKKNHGLPYALASMVIAVLILSLKFALYSPISVLAPNSQRLQKAIRICLFELRWHLNPKNLGDLLRC